MSREDFLTQRLAERSEELGRYKAALQDIAGADPIPTPSDAFAWCKQVATDALAPTPSVSGE